MSADRQTDRQTDRQFLVINVTYRDSRQQVVTFVSANYRHVLSNILKEDFDAYLDQLNKEGWQLTSVQRLNGGKDEAYYFQLPLA